MNYEQNPNICDECMSNVDDCDDTCLRLNTNKMKVDNRDPTQLEKERAEYMLDYIYIKLKIYTNKIPDIAWKKGGYRATYRSWDNTIELRADSWRKMDLVTKRLIMCHEVLHALGLNHNEIFGATLDILPLELYGMIWGEDEQYWKLQVKLETTIKELIARNQ